VPDRPALPRPQRRLRSERVRPEREPDRIDADREAPVREGGDSRMLAPRSNDAPSTGQPWAAGNATSPGRCRSPGAERLPTPRPAPTRPDRRRPLTATTVPALSMFDDPGTRAAVREMPPRRASNRSGSPDYRDTTRTSCGPGTGSGRPTSFSTSGPPVSVHTTAPHGADGSVGPADLNGRERWATTSAQMTNGLGAGRRGADRDQGVAGTRAACRGPGRAPDPA
jgi:hypothetical protein